MSFQTLPKIELHTHLEGCAPPDFIRMLAAEKKIDINGIFTPEGGYDFRDFDHFLKVYEAACTTLQTPDDFRRLTLAVLQETAAHGVVYLETFVSPDFCGGGDLAAWKDYLAAMSDAAAEGEARFGITMRGIVTGIRHFGPDACKPAARCAAETFGGFVVGYGMAGGEMAGRPADYAYSFDIAREAGLPPDLSRRRMGRCGHGGRNYPRSEGRAHRPRHRGDQRSRLAALDRGKRYRAGGLPGVKCCAEGRHRLGQPPYRPPARCGRQGHGLDR